MTGLENPKGKFALSIDPRELHDVACAGHGAA
jgi:hypothetical protein